MSLAYILIGFLVIGLAYLYWTVFRLHRKHIEANEKNAFLDELLRNTGISMYKTKRIDGEVLYYFKKDAPIETDRNRQIGPALRNALINNELILYYQPKFDLTAKKIVGAEALLRWNNPALGLIDPLEFIPLTEETGLIINIGEWALYEACRANKSWQDQGYEPISIAVNISAKQFNYQNIPELISRVLTNSGLNPSYLELEITESAIMEDVELGIKRLNEIKKMGVKISIDDFGTGYTSIKYLKHFPIHAVKIDQSFIKDLPEDKNDAAITAAVIALAHQLELIVVAEGVETQEQLAFLTEHACDIIQGYYVAKAAPEEEFLSLLAKRKK